MLLQLYHEFGRIPGCTAAAIISSCRDRYRWQRDNYYTTGEAGSQNSIKYCNINNEPATETASRLWSETLAGTRVPQVVAGNLVYSDQGASPIGLYVCPGLPQATTSSSLLYPKRTSQWISLSVRTSTPCTSPTTAPSRERANRLAACNAWDASGSGPDGFPGYTFSYTLKWEPVDGGRAGIDGGLRFLGQVGRGRHRRKII